MAQGYVYILFNPGLRANQFKIGLTTNTPQQRARELSRATGVPQPYEVAYSVHVEDCAAAERLIHAKLNPRRIAKEFFELPLDLAVTTLNEIAAVVGRVPHQQTVLASAVPHDDALIPVAQEFEFSSPEVVRRKPSSGKPADSLLPATFEGHLQKTDPARREILMRLRSGVKELGSDISETVTRANRIAYSRGRVFLEVKVHKDRIRILFLEMKLDDPEGKVTKVPESHGWGRLKLLVNLTSVQDLDYGMRFIKASYAVAK